MLFFFEKSIKLNEVNINIQALLHRTAGDVELVNELCEILRSEMINYKSQLLMAVSNNDLEQIDNVTHKMKSSVAVLGFDKLSSEILIIEENARKKSMDFDFSNKINCIFISLNDHLTELENFLKK